MKDKEEKCKECENYLEIRPESIHSRSAFNCRFKPSPIKAEVENWEERWHEWAVKYLPFAVNVDQYKYLKSFIAEELERAREEKSHGFVAGDIGVFDGSGWLKAKPEDVFIQVERARAEFICHICKISKLQEGSIMCSATHMPHALELAKHNARSSLLQELEEDVKNMPVLSKHLLLDLLNKKKQHDK